MGFHMECSTQMFTRTKTETSSGHVAKGHALDFGAGLERRGALRTHAGGSIGCPSKGISAAQIAIRPSANCLRVVTSSVQLLCHRRRRSARTGLWAFPIMLAAASYTAASAPGSPAGFSPPAA